MNDVYGNIDDYSTRRKGKSLIVFDALNADIKSNKKFQVVVKELFIRCRKLNISLVFITQSYFSGPKMSHWIQLIIWLWKLTTKENYKILQLIIQQILIIRILWRFTESAQKNRILFLTIGTTLPVSDPLIFRKNLFVSFKNDCNWSKLKSYTEKLSKMKHSLN